MWQLIYRYQRELENFLINFEFLFDGEAMRKLGDENEGEAFALELRAPKTDGRMQDFPNRKIFFDLIF